MFAKVINIYLTGKSSNRNINALILRTELNINKRLFYGEKVLDTQFQLMSVRLIQILRKIMVGMMV